MESVSILGKMVASTRVNTKTIKNMAMEFIPGQMEEFIKEVGPRVNSMALEPILFLAKAKSTAYGRRASELNGLTKNKWT